MSDSVAPASLRSLTAFTRNLFNSTFKTNPSPERAVMTGLIRVSKKSCRLDMIIIMNYQGVAAWKCQGNEYLYEQSDIGNVQLFRYRKETFRGRTGTFLPRVVLGLMVELADRYVIT